MVVEEEDPQAVDRGRDGVQLREDIDAVGVLRDHPSDAPDLSLDASHPLLGQLPGAFAQGYGTILDRTIQERPGGRTLYFLLFATDVPAGENIMDHCFDTVWAEEQPTLPGIKGPTRSLGICLRNLRWGSVKRADVRFYVDAGILGLGKLLAGLRPDVTYPADPGATIHKRTRPPCPITDPATPDSIWIPEVASRDWLIITRDSSIRAHRAEIEAVKATRRHLVSLSGRMPGRRGPNSKLS